MEITSIYKDPRSPSFPTIIIIKKQQIQQQRRWSRRRPPKAAGCCCWTRPRQGGQGRRDRARPEQAKARHNKQASQAKPSKATCDPFENMFNFWTFWFSEDQKWSKKVLRLRGWNLSGEFRAGIPHRTPLRMSKTVGRRPIW